LESKTIVGTAIVYGTLVMLLLTAWNIYLWFFHRKRMAEKDSRIFAAAAEAEEQERRRIADNLHDQISGRIAIHKQVLEKFAFDIERNKLDLSLYRREIASLENLRKEVMLCATNLVPSFLLDHGLVSAIEDHLSKINLGGMIRVTLNNRLPANFNIAFSLHDQLQIFRVFLELVNNLIKYGRPTEMSVSINGQNSSFSIVLVHNGIGVSTSTVDAIMVKSSGLGLKSIRARAMLLRAKVSYLDSPGSPAILFSIPHN
jgi:signal transduction histidine kinase